MLRLSVSLRIKKQTVPMIWRCFIDTNQRDVFSVRLRFIFPLQLVIQQNHSVHPPASNPRDMISVCWSALRRHGRRFFPDGARTRLFERFYAIPQQPSCTGAPFSNGTRACHPASELSFNNLVECRRGFTIKKRYHLVTGYVVSRATVHCLEGSLIPEFNYSRIITASCRIEESSVYKAIKVFECCT